MAEKPKCQTVLPWLKANLGPRCLNGLTSTDFAALQAAVQIAELWVFTGCETLPPAFGAVVRQMQEKERELAFHSVAHCGEWEDRWVMWNGAGLDVPENLRRCAYEPGGSQRGGGEA